MVDVACGSGDAQTGKQTFVDFTICVHLTLSLRIFSNHEIM